MTFCSDIPALVDSMFLELLGLGGHLSLFDYLSHPGSRLSGVHVCGHTQTSTEGYQLTYANTRSHHVPQGK